jgi:outer membrane protein assembly factor BamB
MRKLLLVLSLAAAIGGCSTIKGAFRAKDSAEPPKALTDFTASVQFEKVWSASLGDGPTKAGGRLVPSYANGRVFLADAKGEVAAFDVDSGRKLWETDTGARISGGPGAGPGAVVLGTLDGEVIALNPETGASLWKAQATSEIIAAPAVGASEVYVRSNDGGVAAFNAASGERKWLFNKTLPLLTLRGNSAPVLVADRVVVGFDNGRVVALNDADGAQVWEQSLSDAEGRTELERITDIDGTVVVDNNELFAVAYNGRTAQLDLTSGRTIWVRDVPSFAGIGVSSAQVFVSDSESNIEGLDRRTGASLWKMDAFQRRALTSPAEVDGVIVVGDYDGYLHALKADTGAIVGRTKQGGDGFSAPPLAVGKTVFALDRSGTLVAYRLSGG